MTLKSFQGYGMGNWSAASDDGEREEWTRKYSNLSLSRPLSALPPQICATKWTYNWKSGGPRNTRHLPSESSGYLFWWVTGLIWAHGGEDEGERKSLGGGCCWSLCGTFSSCIVFLPLFFFYFLFFTLEHKFSRPSFPLFQHRFSL